MQEHEEAISEVGFVPYFQEIDVEYDPGTTIDVTMHDGSHLRLRKLHEDFDPTDRIGAVSALMAAHANDEVLTGIFYLDTAKPTFTELLNLVDEPLATLPDARVRPGKAVLEEFMQRLM
jgi:2-oxoglutarate ferredoxin oxidoreductase subunit beta